MRTQPEVILAFPTAWFVMRVPRTVPILLASLLLAVPLSVQALDAGARQPIILEGRINDVAIASQTGAIALVTQDPGSRLAGTPDKPVWFLYTSDGRNLLQDGDADPPECEAGSGFTLDDCQTHATQVAVNRDGTRMLVASVLDGSNSRLLFITDRQGAIEERAIEGAVQDVALSDDGGSAVAVATMPNAAPGNKTRIYYYSWSSSVQGWTAQAPEAASSIAVSPDGQAFVVGAGTDHYRFQRTGADSAVVDRSFSDTATSVAIANGGLRMSIAGSSSGWIHLYSDQTGNDRRELRVRDVTSPVTAVAVRSDATAIAIGNQAGDLWVYRVDPALYTLPGQVARLGLGSAISSVAFAGDGQTLVVSAGTGLHHYAVESTSLKLLWTATLAEPSGRVAVTHSGSTVLSANATAARLFDAKHALVATPPTDRAATPGALVQAAFTLQNTGNRMATLTLTAGAPTGWQVGLSQTSLRLAPDESATIQLNATVPAFQAPGAYPLSVHASGPAGATSASFQVNVPSMTAWALNAQGSTSLGVQAGSTQTFPLNVTNLGNVQRTPALTATVQPSDWSAELVGVAAIAPGESQAVAVLLRAPVGAAQLATGTVTVRLPDATGSPLVLTGTVGASFAVDVAGAPALQVPAGNQSTLTLNVRNLGNAPDGVRLTMGHLPTGWSVQWPSGAAEHSVPALSAQETIQVPLVVHVTTQPAGAPPVQLEVTAASLADASKTDTHRFLVTVTAPASSSSSTTQGKDGIPGLPPALLMLGLLALALRRRVA